MTKAGERAVDFNKDHSTKIMLSRAKHTGGSTLRSTPAGIFCPFSI